MVNIIFTSILICLFFMLGHFTQAFKKLFSLITSTLLKILSFFGIKITNKEHSVKVSDDFKNTYKDIKKVKLSKKNIKQISSIDWIGLAMFITCGLLILINFGDNVISNWLYELQAPFNFIKSAVDMNTFFTAIMFSALSFSFSRLLARWKETKQQRIEAKNAKIKMQAMDLMDSKELLDEAKKKDDDTYKGLK